MAAEHHVTLHEVRRTSTGPRYRVTMGDRVLVDSSRDPECDACRVLVAQGATGKLITRRAGSDVVCLRVDIARGAQLRVSDPSKGRLHWVKWSQFEVAK